MMKRTDQTAMLASLPMYDLPEIRPVTDRFWQSLAAASGVEGGLTRDGDYMAAWRDPDLFFSQTCGYPFTHEFAGMLKYLATPHYDADGCEGPLYRSILFARETVDLSSFRGKTAAFNNRDSMSGMLALKLAFAPWAAEGKLFAGAIETGGHVASLAAVRQRAADVAAIDCVTVALLRKHRPAALDGLVEVGRSPLVPALPFVTRAGDVHKLREALSFVVADTHVRDALMLSSISLLTAGDYDVIPALEMSLPHAENLHLW